MKTPKPTFILDCHLGKLAKYLRLLGFDALYTNPLSDEEIIEISLKEHRIILTKDKGLLKNHRVQQGYFMKATDPKSQVKETLHQFDLKNNTNPFTRCLDCNTLLKPTDKKSIKLHDEAILKRFEKFNTCPTCHKIYWEGSHYRRMQKTIEEFLEN